MGKIIVAILLFTAAVASCNVFIFDSLWHSTSKKKVETERIINQSNTYHYGSNLKHYI